MDQGSTVMLQDPFRTVKKWKKVQILGPFNSGTNLLHQILDQAYKVEVGPIGSTIIWKHTIMDAAKVGKLKKNRVEGKVLGDDVLKIVMVRDPYFWLRSLGKKRYTLESFSRSPDNINDLIVSECKLRSRRYANCVELWNAYYGNYLKHLSPFSSTLYIRYEQLIFEPERVIGVISKYLQLRPMYTQMSEIMKIMQPPSNSRAKNYKDAVKYNATAENRVDQYSPEVIKFIGDKLDKNLMEKLGYTIYFGAK